MTRSYDLVVIGAGSGGVRAARVAANLGASVAIIEDYRVGGTCVIRGCVPKKLYVYASRFADMFEIAGSFGWTVEASFDWATLVANKQREIDRLEKAYTAGLEGSGVEIIRDRGTIAGPNSVRLRDAGETLEAKTILISTGGHPSKPAIPGAELGITSNEAFDLKTLPHSILIEGGGYVAVEFATIFAGLGVKTTLVYRGERILRGFDDDLRTGMEAGMQMRGIQFIYGTTICGLSQAGQDVSVTLSNDVVAPYGAVMFATGRAPNIHGLGLETAGVALTETGAIAVDAYSRTSCPSIYAVGDVTGRIALTPVAIREGQAFAETVFNNTPTAVDHSLVGTAVFGEPEAAAVGLTEHDAACAHKDIDVYLARFRPMINTLSQRSERMVMKLVTLPDGGRVIGCHILGPGAAEIVQMAAIPMAMKADKADFDRAIAMHPTAAEELVTFKAPSCRYRGGIRQ
ncbi:NADPH-glutathione reductase [Devosia enhydra]|uniref:NADPH-glutathione reductase n=1 Tax=Devosia enhydra TaxID=665118 RepID=A0A1K2HTZ0_9HYPH|nr:glutathione-disulfide reductase [Devosia enhydra]SFZ81822.1 NADPH-glutathione reductase [Devosia enhydra]